MLINIMFDALRVNRFSSFVRGIELQPNNQGLTLESQLAKPWQRVMKYALLLREMKERAETDEEKELITRTLLEIQAITSGLNKSQAAQENQKTLLEKQKYYGVTDLPGPARYFVRDGMLKRIKDNKRKDISFILCNDILLYGRKQGTLSSAMFKRCDVHMLQIARNIPGASRYFILRTGIDEGTHFFNALFFA
jgi:hypothetical protein